MDVDEASSRGVLYPARLPTFHREPATASAAVYVRWFWIPEWDVEPERASRQHLVGYPASNLVVENAVTGISGPATRASFRDLTGRGWAVGALLRPAAVPALVGDPTAFRDAYRDVSLPELSSAVRAAMTTDAPPGERRGRAVAAFARWLADRLGAPSDEALLANRLVDAAETDASLTTVDDLAARLHVSTRTLQRLAARYVGLPPAALLRRRRLQEAAECLRADPDVDLADLAQRFGYADHAHLTNDFRTTLGMTPSGYRGSHPA